MADGTHILIVGTGAVGAFYGSRLHDPANSVFVSLVCRSNYAAVKKRGVYLRTRDYGEYHFRPHAVYPSIQAAADSGQTWNYAVVTTKCLPDITDDSAEIVPIVSDETHIVLIQNGIGLEEPHRRRFPQNPILSCVTIVSAAQVEPGVIIQHRWTRVSIGPYGVGQRGGDDVHQLESRGQASTSEFVKMLTHGGVKDAEEYDEKGLQLVRWHKLCINASMNPSAVLSGGAGNSTMSLDTELRIHLKACMDEIFVAAPKVLGRSFPEHLATPDKILRSTERNTNAKPSMLLDWESNRPMEIEVILGNPVRIARAHGVDMPRLQALYALLKMAQQRRDQANALMGGKRAADNTALEVESKL
ncbi:uncharacterized protein L969DRAFT_100678 [Mixia osmundae IAM 14324]|uniref:2-dehydropantoate 2-reductase n=1 Tax=Mixia osmundae (strain CBS 9802 / IAM 14324 / JCM 22182 / KY 12970) TaxID=764103 RepID=G7E005_MIXOS|nr:uncharacterized protein L969DRAFT_100678 [Mixia osmundae IAM 14324]KEI42156.1 hypothetical protein L969DRAFT_100678 [Mixia osmundae IAM 14324]GAA96165.1 hypothetical protein E5Q_02826 [Mixia osmundae IAM 14324]